MMELGVPNKMSALTEMFPAAVPLKMPLSHMDSLDVCYGRALTTVGTFIWQTALTKFVFMI